MPRVKGLRGPSGHIDSYPGRVRVGGITEAEAAFQERLSVAEAEIADLRAKLDASESDLTEGRLLEDANMLKAIYDPPGEFKVNCLPFVLILEITYYDGQFSLSKGETIQPFERDSYALRDVLELTEAINSKDGESETYISEIETIGQAYEDMQAQNQHLLQQMTERDDNNIKVHCVLYALFFNCILPFSSSEKDYEQLQRKVEEFQMKLDKEQ
ncbi:hypothetical protein F3Y22_tig00112289pilonHSYRG00205 [Hibiscus syriacus]|uniref:E3 ubiquitin protein ligase n=1 Tax=Hibiscus syriacus TaxID=106335 RepID=A0A6A2YBT8_HIBSY|nr:hypothetical protein F3Y22_tig00112289pilonHSYRG00205 [Hibiscus syriacus]